MPASDLSSRAAITNIMQPVESGRLAVLTVGGFREGVRVYCRPLKNGRAGEPGGPPLFDGKPRALRIVQRKEECLTVEVPRGEFEALAFSLDAEFEPSRTVLTNLPRLDWHYPSHAAPGSELRLYGRNLVNVSRYKTVDPTEPVSHGELLRGKTRVLARREGDAKFVELPVTVSSAYEARLEIPAKLKPGAYEVFAHNGLGGEAGWSRPLRIAVEPAAKWPTKVFHVDRYIAKAGGVDAGIETALADLRTNGGGVLQFGGAVYLINKTIVLPRFTVLRGEGPSRTMIKLPDGGGPKPPYVAITGDSDFTVEGVRIFSVYAPMLITAPTFLADTYDDAWHLKFDFAPGRRARNVTVRDCYLLMRPGSHEDRRVDSDGGKFKGVIQAWSLSQGQSTGGFSAITLRGDDLLVEGNQIFGGGSCVMMHGCTSARVANNRVEIGPAGHGVYAMCHLSWENAKKEVNGGAPIEGYVCRQIVIEDNEVTAYSQTARDGVYLMYGVEKAFVARNHIHDIHSVFDAEGLGMHLWSGRWTGANLEMETPTRGRIIDTAGVVTYECLDGAQIEIVGGEGMGQLRRIVKREGDHVELEEPWAFEPTERSQVVYTAPPLFNKIALVGNTIYNTGANLILWGCNNDVVVDGNRLADGPQLGIWSVRVQGDQKVWGGSAFVTAINNRYDQGWVSPSDEQPALSYTGGGNIGNPSCTFADSEKMGYDFLGLVMRNNALINNSSLNFRKTFPQYGSDEPWVVNDFGVVIESNHCRDGKVGVVVEKGAAVVVRGNTFQNVERKVVEAPPFVPAKTR